MVPGLSGGIDHVHVYVADRRQSAAWYDAVLGLRPAARFARWAEDPAGPLLVENAAGTIHLALFESDRRAPIEIAFGATAVEFRAWQRHLEGRAIPLRMGDHGAALSIYVEDPDGNVLEITTYDVDALRVR